MEIAKTRVYGGEGTDKATAQWVLKHVLDNGLKMLHPFMPFITEEIWGYLPHTDGECDSEGKSMLISAPWPSEDEPKYEEATTRVELAMEAIKAIRNVSSRGRGSP